jgi:hypothetical protein
MTAVEVALAILVLVALAVGRLSTTSSQVGEIMSEELVQKLTEGQKVAHALLRKLNGLKAQHGDDAQVEAHRLFLRNQLQFPDEYGINHDDFMNMKGIDHLISKVQRFGSRQLATF